MLITKRVWLLPRAVTSQLPYVNGHLLPNRDVRVPSSIWVSFTEKDKAFQRTIRLR